MRLHILVHLAVSHLPVIGIPIATVLLLWGMRSGSDDLKRAGLWLLLVIGLLTPVIAQSGDAAKERLEDGTSTMETYIEKHEEAAEAAVPAAVVLAILAGIQLVFHGKKQRWFAGALWICVAGAVAMSGWFAWVAHLGGQIGHAIIR